MNVKVLTALILSTLLLIFAGCSSEGQPSAETSVASVSVKTSQTSAVGDPKAQFDARYGSGENTQITDAITLTIYQPDESSGLREMHVYFQNDRAASILLYFASGDTSLNRLRSTRIAESLLPGDTVKVQEAKDSESSYLITYRSGQIANALGRGQAWGVNGTGEPGTILLTLSHAPNNADTILSAAIETVPLF
jgi:hypothetical protein